MRGGEGISPASEAFLSKFFFAFWDSSLRRDPENQIWESGRSKEMAGGTKSWRGTLRSARAMANLVF